MEEETIVPGQAETSLWSNRDFLKFWLGDTFTQFTGQISGLALPTIAVLILDVTAFQLGVLNALEFLAFPTLGLFVGVWMDRMRRRPVMIGANLIQVVTLGSVPIAFVLSVLSIYQLYAVALIMGITTVFYDVAYQSYLPSLVERKQVVEGNQKLQVSQSASQVVGPSVAGALIQLVGASISVASDAIGTLVAALALVTIRKPEPPKDVTNRRSFFTEMREGIRVVTGNSLLWTQAGCTGTSNLGTNIFGVALILYVYRTLLFTPGLVGIVFSIGAVGFLAGVLTSRRITKRLGFGRSIAVAEIVNFGLLIVILARGEFAVLIVGAAQFISSFGVPVYNINQVSLRQIITPNRLQGRMNATMRTIVWGTIPVGAILGGILTTALGIFPTLVLGALIGGGASLWIILGPIFKLKTQPEPVKE